MSWLRIDDLFDGHAKIRGLGEGPRGDARRWTWMRILLFTARHGSPEVPSDIADHVPRATRAFISDCVKLGLIDLENNEMVVHDWILYTNAPLEDKVAYCLRKGPLSSANVIAKIVGGNRNRVLAIVKQLRPGSDDPAGIERDDLGVPDDPDPVSEPVSEYRGEWYIPDPTRPEGVDSSVSEIRFAVHAREPDHHQGQHLKAIIDASLRGSAA